MPRRPFGQADPTVRADALKRHALVRRMERREKWLERSGIKPELLKEAVETLQAGMHATKLVPAVVDKRGTVLERVEVPDQNVRVKAAAEVAEFVRLVTGLTAEPTKSDTQPAQVALVVNLPDWIVRTQSAQLEVGTPRGRERVVEAAPDTDSTVIEAETTDSAR